MKHKHWACPTHFLLMDGLNINKQVVAFTAIYRASVTLLFQVHQSYLPKSILSSVVNRIAELYIFFPLNFGQLMPTRLTATHEFQSRMVERKEMKRLHEICA